MPVNSTSAERIGGWLLAPLAWLLLMLFTTSLLVLLYSTALINPGPLNLLHALSPADKGLKILTIVCTIGMWYYTTWLTIAFFKRRRVVPKHYVLWLLISVLLAVKTFAFSPITDELALRQLLYPLVAAALLTPYFKRSERVRKTFVNP